MRHALYLWLTVVQPVPDAVDAKIDAYAQAKKASADAQKAEADAKSALQKALDDQNKRLKDLGFIVVPPAPPVPVDPLVAKLQAAYASETSPDKAMYMAKLIILMQKAQDLAGTTQGTVNTLAGTVAAASTDLMTDKSVNPPVKRLPGVRQIFSDQLKATWPDDVPLTDDVRSTAKALFLRFEKALTEASK